MNKQDILNYVKGYYKTFRQTKNGLFIYSGIKRNSMRFGKFEVYTYISNEEIEKKYAIDWIKEGLDCYIEEVKRFGGLKWN